MRPPTGLVVTTTNSAFFGARAIRSNRALEHTATTHSRHGANDGSTDPPRGGRAAPSKSREHRVSQMAAAAERRGPGIPWSNRVVARAEDGGPHAHIGGAHLDRLLEVPRHPCAAEAHAASEPGMRLRGRP